MLVGRGRQRGPSRDHYRKPRSIYELAKLVERDFKNVYADVQFLNDVGLIKLKDTGGSRKGLKPIAKYSGIELDLVA